MSYVYALFKMSQDLGKKKVMSCCQNFWIIKQLNSYKCKVEGKTLTGQLQKNIYCVREIYRLSLNTRVACCWHTSANYTWMSIKYFLRISVMGKWIASSESFAINPTKMKYWSIKKTSCQKRYIFRFWLLNWIFINRCLPLESPHNDDVTSNPYSCT